CAILRLSVCAIESCGWPMIELLSPDEMAEADRRTIAAGTPGIELMERAGLAAAERAAALVPCGARVAAICGPGHNGGAGLMVGRIRQERGYRVRVGLLASRRDLRGDAGDAPGRWTGATEASARAVLDCGLIVDALFGAGLS